MASAQGVNLEQDFYVSSLGGTIDNAGFDISFSGDFSDHLPDATLGGLVFTGFAIFYNAANTFDNFLFD